MTKREGKGTCRKAGSILCPDLGGGYTGVKYIKLCLGFAHFTKHTLKKLKKKKLTVAWTRQVTEVTERCEQNGYLKGKIMPA